jgi:hypothetical protein
MRRARIALAGQRMTASARARLGWGIALLGASALGGCGLLVDTDPPDPSGPPGSDLGAPDLGTEDLGLPPPVDGGAPPTDGASRDASGPDGGRVDSGPVGCGADADCDDGIACNGIETCAAGVCVVEAAPACPEEDGVRCTVPVCDPVLDRCVEVADDGACGEGEYCDTSDDCKTIPTCGSDAECVPADGCLVGKCTMGTCDFLPRACPDLNPSDCLVAVCEEGGCRERPADRLCDDGIGCTRDRCGSDGTCRHDPDPGLCDDRAACTQDVCDPTRMCSDSGGTSGCRYERQDATCSAWRTGLLSGLLLTLADALECSGAECVGPSAGNETGCALTIGCASGETCSLGRCAPTRLPRTCALGCSDGNPCNGEERCGSGGFCEPAPGDVCTPPGMEPRRGRHCAIERGPGGMWAPRCVPPTTACGLTDVDPTPVPAPGTGT